MVRCVLTALALTAGVAALTATPNTAAANPVAPGGKIVRVETVPATTTDVYTVTLRGQEATRIRVSGDGDTCLELRVYDEFGNLVASDTLGLGDDRMVLITPKWTGQFKVKVANLGKVSNKYIIVMD